mgnify:CR=1 FL=1
MTDLWVERTGVRRYTGRSTRGAEVLVGSEDVDGVFTPGELMKIALAACSGMSSDQPLRRRLGDDYPATIRVSGAADREQERYPLLDEKLEVDLSGLSDDEVARLVTVVTRAIDQVCTVGRTLKSGTEVTFEVSGAGVSWSPLDRMGARPRPRRRFPVVDAVPGAGAGSRGVRLQPARRACPGGRAGFPRRL